MEAEGAFANLAREHKALSHDDFESFANMIEQSDMPLEYELQKGDSSIEERAIKKKYSSSEVLC